MPAVVSRIPAPVDVTNLDFDMAFGRLVELVGSLYPWLDLESRAEVARMHMEAMAHVGGHFHFYLNRMGRESRWGTANERTHLLAALKLIGYRPATAKAAIVSERFTLIEALALDVPIPAGTFVRTDSSTDPIRFQTLAAAIIPAGSLSVDVSVEHSESVIETYLSNGRPFQRFRLGSSPYLDGSLVITTPLGAWAEVDNFLASTAVDRHFVTQVDSQDRVTVIFGNNRTGQVPTNPIEFAYKIGGGILGRLPAGALKVADGAFADTAGNAASITVTNPLATSGGEDRESEAAIKQNAPGFLTVQRRAVSRVDYEAIAKRVPGVAFALMLTRNESTSILENEGFLFVVPSDGSVASDELLALVAAQFGDDVAVGASGVYVTLPEGDTPKTVTFQLRVRPAAYKPVDLFAKVYMRKGARPAVVQAAVEAAYSSFFAVMVDASTVEGSTTSGLIPNPRITFGYYLQDVDGEPTGHFPISDVEAMLVAVTGVRELGDGPDDLTLNEVPRNVSIEPFEFPIAGTVTLQLA